MSMSHLPQYHSACAEPNQRHVTVCDVIMHSRDQIDRILRAHAHDVELIVSAL